MITQKITSYLRETIFIPVFTVILFSLLFLPLRANSAETSPESLAETESEKLIRSTAAGLRQFSPFSADLSIKIHLFDEDYTGTGHYEELILSPKNQSERDEFFIPSRFRLHIEMPLTGADALKQESRDNLLEIVCDENSLWTYTLIEDEQNLSQINLNEMGEYISQMTEKEKEELKNNGMLLPAAVGNFPAVGGLSGSLLSLLTWYQFEEKPEVVYFNRGKTPVWKLSGKMKPNKRSKTRQKAIFLNDDQHSEKEIEEREQRYGEILNAFPDAIEVYIGQNARFPFRIVYLTIPHPGKGDRAKPVMTVNITKVLVNQKSITTSNFIYAPRINSERRTKSYLKSLAPSFKF